jgi:hypothetical protein
VYIYQFDESDWIETKLTPYDGKTGDAFGASVAVSDVTVVVGASLNDDGGFASGSAYIYKLVDSSWIETKLLASDDDSHDHFGSSIAVSGETIVVGAYGDDDNGSDSGSAYIFYLEDTDGDGVPDSVDNCYLYNPDQADCNDNGIGDVCDIDDQTSYDCDQNGVPDECQPDCDGDGWIDPCDNEGDCDDDGIPDNCELDCNENDIPDDCDINFGFSEDCNENGVPDECDIENGLEEDCNGNGVPDSCDLAGDPSLDCDGDGLLDSCVINDGEVEDCNGNNIPDSCEIDDGTTLDCNDNGVPDSCEVHGETKLLASDGTSDDWFGASVSISGDGTTAIVGARLDDDNGNGSGSVYIYSFVQRIWQETKLLASDGVSDDRFGYSVSISNNGTTAIVGARLDDDNGVDSGSAYIYSLVGGVWQETKLLASDGESDDHFGYSVSISSDGTTAIVGALLDDVNGVDSGSAYIYSLVDGVWQETKLLASDGEGFDQFGKSVSISSDGTTAIVGAYGDDDNGNSSGSAYIYKLVDGAWQETKLLANDGASGDYFGHSVSITSDGTTAIVGAHWGDDNGIDSGSAYIYSLVDGVWQETKLLASDGEGFDQFGISVSISSDGTAAFVGAYGDGNDSGSAYIYSFAQGIWQETKLLANDGASDDWFGFSVSISSDGTTAFVGAIGNDENGSNSGSSYIYASPFIYAEDCNANGVPDECDIDDGTSNDVNGNSIPDECEVDCNGNGVPDHWDIKKGTSEDCNTNGIPDECDIDDGTSNDVNENGIPDECEDDCNTNGYPDDYDITMGWSYDVNGDGIPDECQCIADITGDNTVDVEDLLAIIGYWGSDGPLGDVNADGIVDVLDLLIVIGNWGPCE